MAGMDAAARRAWMLMARGWRMARMDTCTYPVLAATIHYETVRAGAAARRGEAHSFYAHNFSTVLVRASCLCKLPGCRGRGFNLNKQQQLWSFTGLG